MIAVSMSCLRLVRVRRRWTSQHPFGRTRLRRRTWTYPAIEASRDHIEDRYIGGPLSHDWKDRLGNFDVHESGDFALTRFMAQRRIMGSSTIGSTSSSICPRPIWQRCWARRSGHPGRALIRASRQLFFRTPQEVVRSLARVQGIDLSNMDESWLRF